MRCFFMRGRHIVAVEEFDGLGDEEAVARARAIFERDKNHYLYDGFEVWERKRVITRYPPEAPPETPPA